MTIEKTAPGHRPGSDAALRGQEAMDLYLTEIGRTVVAISEQSALLMKALGERVALLCENEAKRAGSPAVPAECGRPRQ